MRILVITRSAWDDSNSIGNTMTNLWQNWPESNLANLYFREALPQNEICKLYFSLSDNQIFKSLINPFFQPGRKFIVSTINNVEMETNQIIEKEEWYYGFFRKRDNLGIKFLQEILWFVGYRKRKKINRFLDEFEPDLVFSPCFLNLYTHKVLWYIKKHTNAKVVLFHADDYLSYVQKSINPFINLYQNLRIRQIKKSAMDADMNYCISHKQCDEYERILHKEMRLLYKGSDFLIRPAFPLIIESERIKIVYIGSILYGRWRTLGMLARAIKKINNGNPLFELMIYSQYLPTSEMRQEMIIEGISSFMGKAPNHNVHEILKDSHVVLHVESFEDVEKLKTRLSFSTKIVDCLASGRSVMAIGWENAASIDYLFQNDAALVANDEKSIAQILEKIKDSPQILNEYARKAWECGKKNHQINNIQQYFYNDISQILA